MSLLRIEFVQGSGERRTVFAETGRSIMRIATAHQIPGIIGECGGCAACGTCHAYIDAPWVGLLSPPTADEAAMLEGLDASRPGSRLTCQIPMTGALDGIVVVLP